jgi:23S rRNA U2552 (ribose-2'-O)-methylase RlmE/FtsJ
MRLLSADVLEEPATGVLEEEEEDAHLLDLARRVCNPAEFLPLVMHVGLQARRFEFVARSALKLCEIFHRLGSPPRVRVSLSLCEAPGSFVQVIQLLWPDVRAAAASLDGKEALQFRVQPSAGHRAGDLLLSETRAALVSEFGGRADIVTADGSTGAARLRDLADLPLILAEALTAISCLRKGGMLVLKVFSLMHPSYRRLVHALLSVFQEVHLVKPAASRPSNQERFLVGLYYTGDAEATDAAKGRLDALLLLSRFGQAEASRGASLGAGAAAPAAPGFDGMEVGDGVSLGQAEAAFEQARRCRMAKVKACVRLLVRHEPEPKALLRHCAQNHEMRAHTQRLAGAVGLDRLVRHVFASVAAADQ